MIRVEQKFICDHEPVGGKGSLPVVVKSQGHSVALETRVCFCKGFDEPTTMRRTVRVWDPDPVVS